MTSVSWTSTSGSRPNRRVYQSTAPSKSATETAAKRTSISESLPPSAGSVTPTGEDRPECESADLPPDHALVEQERDEALWRSFGRLRQSDQALLRLLMADPRPAYEEIAAALDMPIGSIGPTRQRALERLRQELETSGELALMTA